MLDVKISLTDIFRSSANALRVIPIQDFSLLREQMEMEAIVAERCALEPMNGGIMQSLQNISPDFLLNDVRVWQQYDVLKPIGNSGGSAHQALCFLAAAWLIDQGYSVSSESWRNGKRIDIATECGTWLIECGDTNPGAVVKHIQHGQTQVMILPFQLDWQEKLEGIIFKKGTFNTATISAATIVEPAFLKDSTRRSPPRKPGQSTVSLTEKFSQNTVRAHLYDLKTFSEFLDNACNVSISAEMLQASMESWQSIDSGFVQTFLKWMLDQGFAISTANRKLSTIKSYAKLANHAGIIPQKKYQLIRGVTGYSHKEGKRIDTRRETTRVGDKKAEHVSLSPEQAARLKRQPNTPQGRRDGLMMCLLLDHGLRVGEVAVLRVAGVDLRAGAFSFFRPKVDKRQIHRLTDDALAAMQAWFRFGDAPEAGPLLRGSRKGGALTHAGMSERAITARVRKLGEELEIPGLSAHDCRHYWATRAANQGTDAFALRDAGGWNSIAMPSRYVEAAEVANERVKL